MFPVLLVVVGVWNISFKNSTPLPVSIPVVFAPPTVSVYVAPIPVKSLLMLSNTVLVV